MAPEPVALVPLAAANALVRTLRSSRSPPLRARPPSTRRRSAPREDDGNSDDDYDSEDEEQNHLINGARSILRLPPGAEVRQRIGTSKLGIKKRRSRRRTRSAPSTVTKNGRRGGRTSRAREGRARGTARRERWFNQRGPEVKTRKATGRPRRTGSSWAVLARGRAGRRSSASMPRRARTASTGRRRRCRKVKRLEKIKGAHEPTMTYAAGVIVAPGPERECERRSTTPRRMPMSSFDAAAPAAGKRKRDDMGRRDDSDAYNERGDEGGGGVRQRLRRRVLRQRSASA